MRQTGNQARRASARPVAPYVYDYRPDGENTSGYQVRFKRRLGGRTESCSQYFAVAIYGSVGKALDAALEWRNANLDWLTDADFQILAARRRYPRLQQVVEARRAKRKSGSS